MRYAGRVRPVADVGGDGSSVLDARRRSSVLARLADREGGSFDIVVIGGGINGAGIAHDAALRGFKVLLVEQRDLAFGTSSRSSKLIHGGLRYLEHYQFKLVFEGTNERAALRKIAPHLVRPLLFALPVYEKSRHPLWLVDIGLWMYDFLSLFKVDLRHVTLRSAKRMLEREPLLNPEGLTGGIIYYDCVTDDARLTLENALAAARRGSVILTRAKVEGLESVGDSGAPGAGSGPATVILRDQIGGRSFAVRAAVVVNSTGVWTDSIRGLSGVEEKVLRPTKGVHLVLKKERLDVRHAVAMLAPQDGRVMFAIPWNGRTVLGTTDTDEVVDPSVVQVETRDVEYLLAAANHQFPGRDLVPSDVIAAWAGLRPLIQIDAENASDVPREHKLFRDGRMVTIAGGKLTTYRRMAQEVVDAAIEIMGVKHVPSMTAKARLPGALGLDSDFDAFVSRLSLGSGVDAHVAGRLANVYGSRAEGVLEYLKEESGMGERVCPDCDVIMAEVAHAVDRELALRVEDVLVRRTSLSLIAEDQALGAAERVADVMGARLGWDARERKANLEEFGGGVALSRAFKRPR